MAVARSERYMYLQNKAHHYHHLQQIKPTIDCSPPRQHRNKHFRPIPLLQQLQIQNDNNAMIQRLVKIEQEDKLHLLSGNHYSRFNRINRPFRSLDPSRQEKNRSVTLDNQQLKDRVERAKAIVGSQKIWNNQYSKSMICRNNMSKFTSNGSKGNLRIATDRFLSRPLRDFIQGQQVNHSNKGKLSSLSPEQLFSLPPIDSSRISWKFKEQQKKTQQFS